MKKLNLNKKVIAKLSDLEQQEVKGGQQYTTTFTECTHFLCCGDGCEASIGTCGTYNCTFFNCPPPADPTNTGCPPPPQA
jgi:hypothetical protein